MERSRDSSPENRNVRMSSLSSPGDEDRTISFDFLKRSSISATFLLILLSSLILYAGLRGDARAVFSERPSVLIKGLYTQLSLSTPYYTYQDDEECYLTRGTWCQAWKAQRPVRWKDPFADINKGYTQGRPMKQCLWNCNHVGVRVFSS